MDFTSRIKSRLCILNHALAKSAYSVRHLHDDLVLRLFVCKNMEGTIDAHSGGCSLEAVYGRPPKNSYIIESYFSLN